MSQNTLERYRKVISLLSTAACLHSIGTFVALKEFSLLWDRRSWRSWLFEKPCFNGLVFKKSLSAGHPNLKNPLFNRCFSQAEKSDLNF